MRQSQSLSSDSSYNSNNSYLQGLSSPASSPEGYPRDQYEQRIPIVFDVARSKSRAKSDKYVHLLLIYTISFNISLDLLYPRVRLTNTSVFSRVVNIEANVNLTWIAI